MHGTETSQQTIVHFLTDSKSSYLGIATLILMYARVGVPCPSPMCTPPVAADKMSCGAKDCRQNTRVAGTEWGVPS